MSTSLAEQLQKLRTPQTTLLLQDKKRPSLLFNPKEAANLDRETVFNIGKSGLDDLVKLSSTFKEFESSLFATSSIGLERSMHDVHINKKLDASIDKFLIALSPYFLLNSAHKSLEWLIYRFHIHEYNKDQFFMLILPYHETRMFVRALQLVDLTNVNDKWHWLEPLQKPGVSLSSITLVNRVSCDNGLLKLLCTHVMAATATITAMSGPKETLSNLYAFYTMAIVGAIERTDKISSVQINHLLPVLANGMSSELIDFASGSCMILAKLSYHVQLNNKTMEHLLLKALKNPQLKSQAMLLLIFFYESPYNSSFSATVSKKLLLRISKLSLSWFCDELNKMQKSLDINVSKFLVPLFVSAINYVFNSDDNNDDDDEDDSDDQLIVDRIKKMTMEILRQVVLEDDDIDAILNSSLKQSNRLKNLCQDAKDLLMQLFSAVELRYAKRFDNYLKTIVTRSETDSEAREALQFLMSCGHCGVKNVTGSLDILDGLSHYIAEQRIIALKKLSNSVNEMVDGISESFQVMVKDALLERFKDDDVRVVTVLLEDFSCECLKSLFPVDIIIDRLMKLLSQCHTETKRVLAQPALKLLLELCKGDGDSDVEEKNETSIFIATLPYLFPNSDDEVMIAMYILQSEFAKKNKYLAAVKDDVMNASRTPNIESIGSASFHNILNWKLLPPTDNILNTMKLSYNSSGSDATSLFFNLILLGSVCRVPVGSLESKVARDVIYMAAEMIKQYPKVRSLAGCNQLNGDKIQDALQLTSRGILPLQAGTYVLEMVHRRLNLQSNSILDFENNCDHAQLIIGLLEILFDGMGSSKHRPHYSWCLKIFFQRHCPTSRDMLRFLAQFFIEPVKAQTSLHCLKIALDVLKNVCRNSNTTTHNSLEWIFHDETFIVNLLVALSRVNIECREVALDILSQITSIDISGDGGGGGDSGCFRLFSKLMEKSTDIATDAEQLAIVLYTLLSPDPDVQHHLKKKLHGELKKTRTFLINAVLNEKMPIHARSQLLQVLAHVNGPTIIEQLTNGIGFKLLDELTHVNDEQVDKIFTKMMLKNILVRFNSTIVDALMVENVWKFYDVALNNYDIKIAVESDGRKMTQTEMSPSVILLRQIDEVFFENCGKSLNLQEKILSKLVDIVTYCEITSVVTAANKAARRIIIDARLIVDELRKMLLNEAAVLPAMGRGKKKSQLQVQRRRSEMVMINRPEWKRGITILEFIQRAENIVNEELLMKVSFDLLRMCLAECEGEPSPSVEYTNQLVLSTIHRLTARNLPISDAHEQVELISQCIRTSHNPQTHHHALLVLVELFKVADVDMALHNIMPIFTFMGNSVLRQDDAYSIQIISKIIDTVVPTIVVADNEIHACTILRIFIVSLPDIPEHRRIPLFVKLIELMENNLYLFYLIMFECHVKGIQHSGDQNNSPPSSSSSLSSVQRFEFALTISREFSPNVLIRVCVKLVEFLRTLPVEIDENTGKKYNFAKKYIFDVANSTPKQLRHYKYTIVQFLSAIVSSADFINRVTILDNRETNEMIPYYDDLLIQLIMIIESASNSADVYQGKPKGRYWKVLVHNLYDILDGVNGLLPNNVFIMSIKKLINPNGTVMMVLQRKAIELLNIRLQQRKFAEEDRDNLLVLIDPLLAIVTNRGNEKEMVSQEMEMIQQTCVITLKLLAKSWAGEYPDKFQPVLSALTVKLMEMREGPLLGSVVLGVAELCGTMRTHAIKYINQFVPSIIKLLTSHCNNYDSSSSSSVFIISVVTAIQKIVESMGNFLSLYLDRLVLELCRASCLYNVDNINGNDNENKAKIGVVVARIQATSVKLSNCIPMRVLLPVIEKVYNRLMEMKLYRCIDPLMGILSESFNHMTSHDVEMAIGDIGQLFVHILQFREVIMIEMPNINSDQLNDDKINVVMKIEDCIGKALVSCVLKLSEATFRPFYYKLYDWAARNDGEHKERNITFYKLSSNIAECLKSLFVLFAGHFLKHAALLLSYNITKMNDAERDIKNDREYTIENELSRIELINAILSTLHKVFSYDAHHFVNKERFEMVAGPIIDQIENTMGTKEDDEMRARDLIIPCIGAFVSAIQDDSLHKQVVYQTLLKTRHAMPDIRRRGVNALLEIARKLGEDFMPLLSETIPFIAELLEDEDESTEKAAQNAVRTLEEILGEPLQKYF